MKTMTNSSLANLSHFSAEGKAIQRLPLEADSSQWLTTIERGEEIDLDVLQQQISVFKASGQKQKSKSEISIRNSGKSISHSTGSNKAAIGVTAGLSQPETASIYKSTKHKPSLSKSRIKRGFGKLSIARD
jgi:hypothetical protein